jgi:regulator of protease activity HflC (stomatin/prohibitin superfamily)
MKTITKAIKFTVFAVIAMFAMSSCTNVRQGEVALRIYELGDKKGEIEVLGPGRYALHWFGHYSYMHFPSTLQQWSWTADGEGRNENEEVVYQSEGEKISADIGIEFEFPKTDEEIVAFYRKYRKNPQEFIDQHLRKDVRSAFNLVVEALPIEVVYSTGKDDIRKKVQQIIADKYAKDGVVITEISYLSNIRLSKQVQDAITAKLEAKQKAEMRENEVAATRAEAQKKEIEAEVTAKTTKMVGEMYRKYPEMLELERLKMQTTWATSAANWDIVNFAADQSGQLLSIPTPSK